MRFIASVIIFLIGLGLMKYAHNIERMFGNIDWAESSLGGGGTHNLYKIVGFIAIILSFAYLFGII